MVVINEAGPACTGYLGTWVPGVAEVLEGQIAQQLKESRTAARLQEHLQECEVHVVFTRYHLPQDRQKERRKW